MVCTRPVDPGHCEHLLTAFIVYIPSINTITHWVGHRQRAPVAIPQAKLPRRSKRDNTYQLAYKVINSRLAAQNGLPFAREGLAVCP